METAANGKVLRRANPSTIQDKFLVGYQGWFTCHGDGKPLDPHHHGWLHWMTYPIPHGGRPNTDLWPDVSEYSPSELYPAPGLKFRSGEQAYLFSSRNARTVQRHFHWMAMHGVDGAFLQRFAGQCDLTAGNLAIRDQRDEVGDRVREAAEKEGRVFAIMYDVTGVAPDKIQQVIESDWIHLVREKAVLDSPSYLREKGKIVVALWGFGFADTRHKPQTVRNITNFIRNNTPGGAYIIGGVPAHWRTSTSDADVNPEFVNVWLEEFDALSPWTVGRYSSLEDADRFAEEKIKPDLELIRKRNEQFETGRGGKRKIDYMPVVLPGGSGFNLSEGKWSWNGIPRRGGNFLWRQLFNVRRQNVRIIYGAMWDEYDEGTAFLPVVQNKRLVPKHEKYNFMALDEDGFDLPPDWFMRICGFAVEGLRGERLIHETFPNKELQDYWSTRPRYEEGATSSSSSAGGAGSNYGYGVGTDQGKEKSEEKTESWEEWQKKEEEKEKQKADEPPPPPYSLEAELADVPPQTPISQAPVPPSASRPTPTPSPVPSLGSTAQVAVHPNIRRSSLNAFAGHSASLAHPATPPANTRPTSTPSPSISPRPAAAVASHQAPPPVSSNSRPSRQPTGGSPSPSNWQGNSHYGPQGLAPSVSSLADDFGRQTLTSSPPPRVESLHHAQAHPTSGGPGTGTGPHVQASTKPINPYAAPPATTQPYGPSSFYQQAVPSHSASGAPYGSGFPVGQSSTTPYSVPGQGGYSPSPDRQDSMPLPNSGPGANTSSWSQPAWPPTEWGQPQQQQSQFPYQPYQPKRNQNPSNQQHQHTGYQPSYVSSYGNSLPSGPAPPPSLQSRPSVSGPHGYSSPEPASSLPYLSEPNATVASTSPPPPNTSSPPPLHGPSPPPKPSHSSSTYSTGSDVGDFSFPMAQPSTNTTDFYNAPPHGQSHGPSFPPQHQGSGYFGAGESEGSGYLPYGQPGPSGFSTPGSEGYGTPGPGGFTAGPPMFPSPASNYPPPPVHHSRPTYGVGGSSYYSGGGGTMGGFSGLSARDISQGFSASAAYLSNQVGRATGQGGSLHTIAQSSEKWFGKLKK